VTGDRLSTGVEELDLVLDGGLQSGSLVVLAGGPGTGKTILAQQICFASASRDHKAIYYTTLSEPHSKLVRHLEPFSFFDADALGDSVEFIHLGDLLLQEDGGGLDTVVSEVVDRCFADTPAVVVIDSAKALQVFADDQSLRAAYYELASRVAHTQAVVILVGEYTAGEIERNVEFALADGIIQLANEAYEPVDRRWLRVVKMRGALHLAGRHSFRITQDGCEVFPRLETIVMQGKASDVTGRVASGVPRLDELLGGGIPAGDATAVLGPSGCGKTVLGLRFIAQGLAEGERCLYASFQESASALVKKAASFGWDLEGPLESGQLVIHHVPQGELNLDTLGAVVRSEVSDGSVRRIILDSLAELVVAVRESDRFPAYARSLIGFIRAAGASVIVTSETTALGPEAEPIGGLSFLFNNVLLLRYIEMESETRRALSILKMRDSAHAKGVYQFEIDAHGFDLMDKLEEVSGVLGWSALTTRAGNDRRGA
jgi:circadian clock protein KaiC